MRKSGRSTAKPELFQSSAVDQKQKELQAKQQLKQSSESNSREQNSDDCEQGTVTVKCFKETNSSAICILCKMGNTDEMLWGELLSCHDPEDVRKLGLKEGYEKTADVNKVPATSVHYGCLLSACNLWQKGESTLQLKGFLVGDLKRESRRCSREVCVFCGQKGAVVGCCLKACKRMFHFPCGLKNNCITEFFGCYNSYCDLHMVKQEIPILADDSCPICVEPFGSERLFHSECCNNVLHTSCLRPYVYNAGTYYLKCPFCQNVRKFKQLVAKYAGIHIPTREPTYEDHDRMVVELVCCYENCPDPDLCIDNEDWRLIKCTICGSRAMHVMCVAKAFSHNRFVCPDCGDNDAYEACHRVQVRVGSGTTVGRMFPWQFYSLKQMLHSVQIPFGHDPQLDVKNKGKGANGRSKGRQSASAVTENATSDSTAVKVGKQKKQKRTVINEEIDPIDYAKRGTKELIGEVDLSSDEEDQDDDFEAANGPQVPMDVSYDDISDSDIAPENETADVSKESSPKKASEEKQSGKKRAGYSKSARRRARLQKAAEKRQVKPEHKTSSNDIPEAPRSKIAREQSKNAVDQAAESSQDKINENLVESPDTSRAMSEEKASKENVEPGASGGRKPSGFAGLKASTLRTTNNSNQESRKEWKTVKRRKVSMGKEESIVDLCHSDSDSEVLCLDDANFRSKSRNKSKSKQEAVANLVSAVITSPAEVPKQATVFKRPMKDPKNMRQVVVNCNLGNPDVNIPSFSGGNGKSPKVSSAQFLAKRSPGAIGHRELTALTQLLRPVVSSPKRTRFPRSPLGVYVNNWESGNVCLASTGDANRQTRSSPHKKSQLHSY